MKNRRKSQNMIFAVLVALAALGMVLLSLKARSLGEFYADDSQAIADQSLTEETESDKTESDQTQAEEVKEYAFSFSGGSGRAVLTCSKLEKEGENYFATIDFAKKNGGESHYDAVRIGEETYEGENSFRIPVTLDATISIEAETLAMSEPHWVSYDIVISTDKEKIEQSQETVSTVSEADQEEQTEEDVNADQPAAAVGEYSYEKSMELSYAKKFAVDYYKGGYKVIRTGNGDRWLWVPEGADLPEGLEDDYLIMYAPLQHIYLAATSAMSLFDAIDGLDSISMTGTDIDGWNIEAPKKALESGDMVFAGKYSEPDYELLISRECDLAIESTMIYHTPEVKEMLEDIDIPVFVDQSSYEESGLARTEWIKLYGALLDKEDLAEEFFAGQEKIMEEVSSYKDTGKTVAYFSLNSDGSVVVRRPDDYVSEMIHQAGATYIFDGMESLEGSAATATISMEEFYSKAVDCDYLVYNSTIEGGLKSLDALIEKDSLFADFAAVKASQVWQVDRSMYQSTATVSNLIRDFHIMLTDGDRDQLTFMSKVKD